MIRSKFDQNFEDFQESKASHADHNGSELTKSVELTKDEWNFIQQGL